MNVQNAKSLEIEEGDVKTIHDKNGQLLWGAVGYDTKYAGDTFQQTYSGKNQLSYTLTSLQSVNTNGTWTNNVYVYNGVTYTVNDDLSINANGATGANAPSYFIINNSLSLTSSTNYVLNGCPSGGEVQSYSIRLYDSGVYSSEIGNGLSFTYGSQNLVRINIFGGITVTNKLFKPMIRFATVTDDTYEPYVGGTPSPNPDYPQDIQVVTGEQTVTVSDGDISQSYTIDLGSTELCKIDTYQDKIFQNVPESDLYNPNLDEGDWYVHKDIAKTIFTGSASESWQYVGGDHPRFTLDVNEIALGGGAGSTPVIMSNYFIGADVSTMYGGLNNSIASHNSVHQIWIRDNSITSDTDFKTWLSTHNTTVYYALATPTDTQITDSTLIGELEAIHEWMTRYGYQASVSGNLPIIIRQDALT